MASDVDKTAILGFTTLPAAIVSRELLLTSLSVPPELPLPALDAVES